MKGLWASAAHPDFSSSHSTSFRGISSNLTQETQQLGISLAISAMVQNNATDHGTFQRDNEAQSLKDQAQAPQNGIVGKR